MIITSQGVGGGGGEDMLNFIPVKPGHFMSAFTGKMSGFPN